MENTMDGVIDKELKVYQEIFSDLVAVRLLNCDKSDFEEAYRISEGMDGDGKAIKRRTGVMCTLRLIGWEMEEESGLPEADQLLCRYLQKCNQWMDEKLRKMQGTDHELLKEVRRLYQLFAGRADEEDNDVYKFLLGCIQKMKEDIDKEISESDICK